MIYILRKHSRIIFTFSGNDGDSTILVAVLDIDGTLIADTAYDEREIIERPYLRTFFWRN